MLRITAVLATLIMVTSFGLVSLAVSGEPDVKKVKGAFVVDSNGKEIGTLIGDHHWASNVQSVIALKIGDREYIVFVRPISLHGAELALFESNDCSGQGYVDVVEHTALSSRSLMGTVPTIASKDPVNDPTNETLWEADTFSSSMKDIESTWDTDAMPPVCAGGIGQVQEVFPLEEVFDLSSLFTPPYSLRLTPPNSLRRM